MIEENFVSFILLHLKAVIYARIEVKRNATVKRGERRSGRDSSERKGEAGEAKEHEKEEETSPL